MSEYIDTSTIDSIALTLLEVSKDPNNVDIYESMYNQLLMEARETLWGGLHCSPQFAVALKNPESVTPSHVFDANEGIFAGYFIDVQPCDFTFAAERADIDSRGRLIAPGLVFEIANEYEKYVESLGVITIAGSYAAVMPGALNFIKRVTF
ncbi:hypothetical protein KA068_01590 [Candidatus Saccharibacteria bacterium]|nr:hypothetical protein [Candidatus Saccharibacteria bacterium]